MPTAGQVRSLSSSGLVPLKTPSFGAESITEGTITEWKVKVGDHVKKGDLLVVIETDKVSVEVHAEQAGVVADILKKAEEVVEVGQALCNVQVGGAAPASPAAAPPAAPATAPAAASGPTKLVEVKTPEFGAESITEGTVQEWKAKVGDYVKKGDIIAAIETDKVTVEVSAPESGELAEIFIKAEETAQVGRPLCSIRACGPGGGPPAAAAAPQAPRTSAAPVPAAVEAPREAKGKPAAAPKAAPAPVPQPHADSRGERRVKMPRMRQAIAKNLKNAQSTQAALTTFNEVDMTGLMALRTQYKDHFEKSHGVKFGLQSVFFKAAANALLQIPSVNAAIDGNDIVFRDYVDIGFAAATPRGLVVPVIRSVESLSLVGVERAFAELAKKAKDDKLTLADMEGGTFNITNGGVFGSMLGTPMIGSTSLSAVLGLHATKTRAVVMPDGSIKARPVMYIALTYDHRLIDGREAVIFLAAIRDQVESPQRMLLDL